MGEEMMVMIRNNPHNYSSWKLYDNPFYYSHSHQQHHHHQHQHQHQHYQHHHHSLNNPPPPSARKLAACLWDLTYIRSIMDSELDMARAKIHELKAELDFQRKSRKKVEALNKKLCKQILEERKRREAVEDVCEKLAKEIASEKMEMDKVKKDIVEERRMLRVAEVLREERVHMKLTEAKILFEEKLSELEFSKMAPPPSSDKLLELEESKVTTSRCTNKDSNTTTTMSSSLENSITVSSSSSNNNNHLLGFVGSNLMNKRRASPEAENPHIKRGIKGFVEFPRVVRAISSRGRQLGSKVECQKAQLRLLLRQKSPFRTDNLIMG